MDKPDSLEGNSSGHEAELQKDLASHAEDTLIDSIREIPPGDVGLDLDMSDGVEGSTSGHEPELQKDLASDAEDMFIGSIRETRPGGVAMDAGCNADSKEEVSIKFEDVNGSVVDADSRQLASDVVNNTEARVSAAFQLGHQSDLSVSPDIPQKGHILPLAENSELDTNSAINADTMMNVDPFAKRNDSDVSLQAEESTKEYVQREEHGSGEYLLADTIMQVDSSSGRKDSDDFVVAKSELLEDVMVEGRKQAEESSTSNNHSLVENKSGNHKVKQFVSDQVHRFPFKRLLQVQFKKGRKSTYKKKR